MTIQFDKSDLCLIITELEKREEDLEENRGVLIGLQGRSDYWDDFAAKTEGLYTQHVKLLRGLQGLKKAAGDGAKFKLELIEE